MKILLIGHRGTGKTHFLERVGVYYQNSVRPVQLFDLDKEIESRSGASVSRIFESEGEAAFRRREQIVFHELQHQVAAAPADVFVTAGAGFQLREPLADDWRVWWIRRETDSDGRIFLNRPRLNAQVLPLQEYSERFADREAYYTSLADRILTVPEGFDFPHPVEEGWVLNQGPKWQGTRTVWTHDLRGRVKRDEFLARLVANETRLELRDDLLEQTEIEQILQQVPVENILLSFRDPQKVAQTQTLIQAGMWWDWPAEWGVCPFAEPAVVSLHHRSSGETIMECAKRVSVHAKAIQKLALPVNSLHELIEGYRWWQQDPLHRCFLPMSTEGRWAWFRLLMKDRMPLNFWREGQGFTADQPLLLDWLRWSPDNVGFGAVLGWPVRHSRTPAAHSSFWQKRNLNSLAVPLPSEDFNLENLDFLAELGLKMAAVTAPLKLKAHGLCATPSARAQDLSAVNTLQRVAQKWRGDNTDIQGLQESVRQLPNPEESRVAIWGGGGTLSMAHAVFPNAVAYSARSAQPRQPLAEGQNEDYNILLWAVGREHPFQWPPAHWKPRLVLDLNYSENSPGREYALKISCSYASGLRMFEAQARAQQDFWLEKDT